MLEARHRLTLSSTSGSRLTEGGSVSSCSSDRLLGAKRTERAGPSLSFFEAGDNDGRSSSAGGKFSFITEGVGKVTRGT